MKPAILFLITASLGVSPVGESAREPVRGAYLEARTCDVWTGPCFSNSEENTTGEFAVMGWQVDSGSLEGVDLAGLRVAAAIRAEGTLGTAGEGKTKAVVFLDERANEAQRGALLRMAKELGGKYLAMIERVESTRIDLDLRAGAESLRIAEILGVTAAPLTHCDKHCGNEVPAYSSLARTDKSSCAKAIEHFFRGVGLKARWSDPFKRSAILGTFSL